MEQARILLIRPNSSIGSNPPPLGLMYLASYLRENLADYGIRILDARAKNLSSFDIKRYIKDYDPDYMGITSLHADSAYLHEVAQISKNTVKRCKVVIGGPYSTSDYMKALKDENVDFCVIGEGEVTFTELIKAIEFGGAIESVKGVAFRHQKDIFYSGHRKYIGDLDKIPFPAWDLINLNEYFYGRKRGLENPMQIYKRAVPLISSRGCPFGCIYCHDIFGKRFRARSPQNLIGEIKYLTMKYDIREIEFLDDTFNFDKRRVSEICGMIMNEKIKLQICFSNGIRADLMDEEMLCKLKEAGTYRINYGIESASNRVQKIIGKGLDIGYAREMIEKTYKHKIICGGFFMFGFPTETEEEMRQTVDLAVKSRLDNAVFSITTPFPGTRLYNMAMEEGRNGDILFSTVGKVTVNMSLVSNEKLKKMLISAYRKFYLDPIRCWRILIRAPRKSTIFTNFLEVLKVAFFGKELYG